MLSPGILTRTRYRRFHDGESVQSAGMNDAGFSGDPVPIEQPTFYNTLEKTFSFMIGSGGEVSHWQTCIAGTWQCEMIRLSQWNRQPRTYEPVTVSRRDDCGHNTRGSNAVAKINLAAHSTSRMYTATVPGDCRMHCELLHQGRPTTGVFRNHK